MAATHFSGPVLSGDLQSGETNGPNQGYMTLIQTTSITKNSTNAVSSTMYIPAGAQIIDFNIDVMTAFDSATSATLTIGTAAAGTQYVSGINAKTAGRASITYTAAQLAAMSGVTVLGVTAAVSAPVVVTVTPVGATTAGYLEVTIIYAQQ
jgi:hypothetical protein